jgi:hypothetical protein
MGLNGRLRVRDFKAAVLPEPGEIVRTGASVQVACGRRYVDLVDLEHRIAALEAVLQDTEVLLMIAWFKRAKHHAEDLGLPREALQDMLF